MPLWSKKTFALPDKNKIPFKLPLLTNKNIDNVLNTGNENVSKSSDIISNSSSNTHRYEKTHIRKSVSLTLSIEHIEENDSETSNTKNKEISTPLDEFDDLSELFNTTPNDVSEVDSILTEEVMNRPDIKEFYLKHWDETFPKEVMEDFWQFSQEWKKEKEKKAANRKKRNQNAKPKQKKEPITKKVKQKKEPTTKKAKQKKEPTTKKAKQKKEPTTKKAKQKEIVENKVNEINKSVTKRKQKEDKSGGGSSQKKLKKIEVKSSQKVKTSKENFSETIEEYYERMLKLQECRDVGLYVYCDSCNKVRYLPDTKDPLDLPDKWYCHMNPDQKHNKCTDPEEVVEKEETLIYNSYNAGSIVWAKIIGYPWWPAMVEDDPDTEQYFWLKEHSLEPALYHVTFFDSAEVQVAWISTSHLKPFKSNMNVPPVPAKIYKKYKTRWSVAVSQANDAVSLPLLERLRKYSFIKRSKKLLVLKNTNKKTDVRRKSAKKVDSGKQAAINDSKAIRIESSRDQAEMLVDVDDTGLENIILNNDVNKKNFIESEG